MVRPTRKRRSNENANAVVRKSWTPVEKLENVLKEYEIIKEDITQLPDNGVDTTKNDIHITIDKIICLAEQWQQKLIENMIEIIEVDCNAFLSNLKKYITFIINFFLTVFHKNLD
jgi:hypothetical protein|uniref:Uncharacterized protein n=1 Tax=Sipha flava TaxID=143950 RepID=A0A2S2PVB8_9HEMI